MLHVTHLELLGGYRLAVSFSDGSTRELDLEAELYGEVFSVLREEQRFQEAFVDPETRTVAWPNGADFAPEFLHASGRVVVPV